MSKYFSGKRVVLTGAGSGLGKAIALEMASSGARHLALIDLDLNSLKSVHAECKKRGTDVSIFKADVSIESEMHSVKSKILRDLGDVDIVIANAGVGGMNPGKNFSIPVDRKIMTVNYFGTVNTLIPYVKDMMFKRNGHLVGISSLAALRGLPEAASYAASKSAQAIFLESLRVDLKKTGVRVTSIYPGFVQTKMTDHDEFDMPFMLTAEKAAKEIVKAIGRNESAFLFPFPMKVLALLNRSLPNFLYDFIMSNFMKTKANREARIF